LKQASENIRFFRPLDGVLLTLVLATSFWGILTFRFTEGTRAVVYVANKKFAWYELSGEKHQITIPTQIGSVILEIGENSARVMQSPCPGKLCIKTGIIRHSHEEVVCLPAKLLLVLEGAAETGGKKTGSDAITY
jgi:hypothetical protein